MGVQSDIIAAATPRRSLRSRRTRVMIVDDSLTVRSVLSRLIDGEDDLEVTAKSSSAELALIELARTPVDVVILDLEMPGMGGIEALPKILATHRGIQVLVVSSLTQGRAGQTLTALSMGAADTMPKPKAGEFGSAYCATLFAKIRALGPNENAATTPRAIIKPWRTGTISLVRHPRLLAIGASTGGIHAMCQLLQNLPQEINLPIVVTQHLPGSFMKVFARQLAMASSRKAVVAEDAMPITGNGIYIAPGGGHLNIRSGEAGLFAKITHQSTSSGCTPSVDPMLESAATATEGQTLAVILSGMGRDGVDGARALVESGGTVFAQDQESSSVWGMPRAIAEEGLATAILPPASLAARILANTGAASWK